MCQLLTDVYPSPHGHMRMQSMQRLATSSPLPVLQLHGDGSTADGSYSANTRHESPSCDRETGFLLAAVVT